MMIKNLVSMAPRTPTEALTNLCIYNDGRKTQSAIAGFRAGPYYDLSWSQHHIRTNEVCQLWPLEVNCTVGEEDGGQTKRVHHGR